MTFDTERRICGLCDAAGQLVHRNPSTFPRILQALDLKKISQLLSAAEQEKLVGLCAGCEAKIKLLEEAEHIRETLKDSFVSNLKKIGAEMHKESETNNHSSPHYVPVSNFTPYTQQTFQQTNEITPYHHSMKRKISSSLLPSEMTTSRRKQLKTQITHALPISPSSNNDPSTSSDEENGLVIDHEPNGIAMLSPNSSRDSLTPPPAHNQRETNPNAVLTDLSSGRNRRKQARPARAAAEPAKPEPIKEEPKLPMPIPPPENKIPPLGAMPMVHSAFPQLQYPRPGALYTPVSAAPSYQALFGANLAAMAAVSPPTTHVLPTAPAQRPTHLKQEHKPVRTPTTPPRAEQNGEQKPGDSLMSNTPSPSSLSGSFSKSMAAAGMKVPAEQHTLLKTDKRRYCKVCAASARKANNGRPPQSRFLCSVCCVPMCRSCIEEHRYRILMKIDDVPDLDSKTGASASARLLQAVKMKDKATVPKLPKLQPGTNSSPAAFPHSTPRGTTPSNSSLIYGNSPMPLPAQLQSQANFLQYQSLLRQLPNFQRQPFGLAMPQHLMPVDMRVPMKSSLKPIAPAPPKLVNMAGKLTKDNNQTDAMDQSPTEPIDEPTDVMIDVDITPCKQDHAAEDAVTTEAAVTDEIASKTAEMLDAMSDDEEDASEKESCDLVSSISSNDFLTSHPGEPPCDKLDCVDEFAQNNPPSITSAPRALAV